jgi:hypothetical protein
MFGMNEKRVCFSIRSLGFSAFFSLSDLIHVCYEKPIFYIKLKRNWKKKMNINAT